MGEVGARGAPAPWEGEGEVSPDRPRPLHPPFPAAFGRGPLPPPSRGRSKGLIVTADDFGLAPQVNEAVERAHIDGVLTTASLMVGAPAVDEAVAIARRNPRLRVGLHLVLVEGRPLLPPEQVMHLIAQPARQGSDVHSVHHDPAVHSGREARAAELDELHDLHCAGHPPTRLPGESRDPVQARENSARSQSPAMGPGLRRGGAGWGRTEAVADRVDAPSVRRGSQVRAARDRYVRDDEGDTFFRTDMARAGVDYFFLPSARRQLAAEIEAQFAAYAATGLPLDHVTTHKHFHLHPTIAGLILRIGRRYGLRAARTPLEPAGPLAAAEPGYRPPAAWVTEPWARLVQARLRAAGVFTPDRVFGLRWSGAMTRARVAGLARNLPPGVTELYTHPATAPGFPGEGPGYAYAEELAALTAPEVVEAVRGSGATLGGFSDFAELQTTSRQLGGREAQPLSSAHPRESGDPDLFRSAHALASKPGSPLWRG